MAHPLAEGRAAGEGRQPQDRRSWLRPEEWAPWQVLLLIAWTVVVMLLAVWATAPPTPPLA